MNNEEKEAYAKKFSAKLDEMDAEARAWEADRRAEFERERDNFRGQLDAWGDYADARWDEFKSNIEQGWRDLEAKWHQWTE